MVLLFQVVNRWPLVELDQLTSQRGWRDDVGGSLPCEHACEHQSIRAFCRSTSNARCSSCSGQLVLRAAHAQGSSCSGQLVLGAARARGGTNLQVEGVILDVLGPHVESDGHSREEHETDRVCLHLRPAAPVGQH